MLNPVRRFICKNAIPAIFLSELTRRDMKNKRPNILLIAGFDPSSGAGITADIKTSEMNKVYGLGVTAAITYQNEDEFINVDWLSAEQIIKQIEVLNNKYSYEYVKIGLIENTAVLNRIVDFLFSKNHNVKIIWDPILKASAGFNFQQSIILKEVEEVCKKIFLITPNLPELKQFYNDDSAQAAKQLSNYCNVFLKGGHSDNNIGKDFLFIKNKQYPFRPKVVSKFPKHGSGCVFSTALAANLARRFNLIKACLRAKRYTEKFLTSNKTLLGVHKT